MEPERRRRQAADRQTHLIAPRHVCELVEQDGMEPGIAPTEGGRGQQEHRPWKDGDRRDAEMAGDANLDRAAEPEHGRGVGHRSQHARVFHLSRAPCDPPDRRQ